MLLLVQQELLDVEMDQIFNLVLLLQNEAINVYIMKYGKVREERYGGCGLPRKGYRTICVTDEVYHYVQQKAAETDRTMPEYIKHLIEKEKTKKETT
jgi:hypothetical protein